MTIEQIKTDSTQQAEINPPEQYLITIQKRRVP